jgi:hypothetical protein
VAAAAAADRRQYEVACLDETTTMKPQHQSVVCRIRSRSKASFY